MKKIISIIISTTMLCTSLCAFATEDSSVLDNGGAIYNDGNTSIEDGGITTGESSSNGGAIYNTDPDSVIIITTGSEAVNDNEDDSKGNDTQPPILLLRTSNENQDGEVEIEEIEEENYEEYNEETNSEDEVILFNEENSSTVFDKIKALFKDPSAFLTKLKTLYATASEKLKTLILSEIGKVKKQLNISTINVFINGFDVDFSKYDDVFPIIKEDRTIVPVRAIMEKFGATVDWDEETQSITITKGSNVIKMQLGSNIITVNGRIIEIDVAPTTYNDRTMVPLRVIAENFGMNVDWDEGSQTVLIEEK